MLTETAQQADVVLPATTFAEKDGSMTNVDHHVQAIRHALRPLPGTRADWEVLIELAARLGQKWSYTSPRDVLLEIAAENPFYAGLTWEDLGAQGVRTQQEGEGSVSLSALVSPRDRATDRAMREGKAHA